MAGKYANLQIMAYRFDVRHVDIPYELMVK